MAYLDLLIIVVLLALGYGFGSYAESRHYKSIIRREAEMADLMIFATKHVPPDLQFDGGTLVSGNAVISVDYFKRVVAGLRNLVGGRLTSYESLIDRARREAVLRMKAEAHKQGATMIFNVKYETASISKGAKDTVGSVEVYAYGTALKQA